MMWFVLLLYFIIENNYYGWNFAPKSDGEVIADGVVVLLLFLCVLNDNYKRKD